MNFACAVAHCNFSNNNYIDIFANKKYSYIDITKWTFKWEGTNHMDIRVLNQLNYVELN